jgi:hypothetical protein
MLSFLRLVALCSLLTSIPLQQLGPYVGQLSSQQDDHTHTCADPAASSPADQWQRCATSRDGNASYAGEAA